MRRSVDFEKMSLFDGFNVMGRNVKLDGFGTMYFGIETENRDLKRWFVGEEG